MNSVWESYLVFLTVNWIEVFAHTLAESTLFPICSHGNTLPVFISPLHGVLHSSSSLCVAGQSLSLSPVKEKR